MADQRGGGIAWTEQTWNPIRGCSRVSEGCRHCYAETVAARFSGPGQPYHGLAMATPSGPRWTGEVAFIEKHLDDPLRWTRPRMIFVNSMSDLFHEKLTNEQIAAIFGIMAMCPQHIFQVLTKRSSRMLRFFEWLDQFHDPTFNEDMRPARCVAYAERFCGKQFKPKHPPLREWPLRNVWLGVSVESEPHDARVIDLISAPAAVRWISYEPALGPVTWGLSGILPKEMMNGAYVPLRDLIHWIVIGGESGPDARPFDLAWARATIRECHEAKVPAFFKQAGSCPIDSDDYGRGKTYGTGLSTFAEHDKRSIRAARLLDREHVNFNLLLLRDGKGGDLAELPPDVRVRQFPGAVS